MALEDALVHYQFGIAYEMNSETQKAIASNEKFLKIWKDADPEIEELKDAKKRLANLKSLAG